MSEPEAGAKHVLRKFGRGFLEVLGGIAALATIVGLGMNVQERFTILEKGRYKELLDLEDQKMRGDLIAEADCQAPETPPLPSDAPIDPWVEQAKVLIAAIDKLIKEAGFVERYEGQDKFDRFDRWRSDVKSKLADGQRLISEAGWTSNENWAQTFEMQTHIKRNVIREPYQPEEFRRFLASGSRILERMKSEVILHSGNRVPATGSSDLTEG